MNWDKYFRPITLLVAIASLTLAAVRSGLNLKIFLFVFALAVLLLWIARAYGKKLQDLYLAYRIRKERLKTGVVIDSKIAQLIILDKKGETAFFKERVYFKQIGRQIDKYNSKMQVTGKLDQSSIRTDNCGGIVNSELNECKISYLKSKKKVDKVFKPILFYAYSLKLNDTFKGENENWLLNIESLTHSYQLIIYFPQDRPVKSVRLMELDSDNNGTELTDKQPLVFIKHGVTCAEVNLFHLDTKTNYNVEWTW